MNTLKTPPGDDLNIQIFLLHRTTGECCNAAVSHKAAVHSMSKFSDSIPLTERFIILMNNHREMLLDFEKVVKRSILFIRDDFIGGNKDLLVVWAAEEKKAQTEILYDHVHIYVEHNNALCKLPQFHPWTIHNIVQQPRPDPGLLSEMLHEARKLKSIKGATFQQLATNNAVKFRIVRAIDMRSLEPSGKEEKGRKGKAADELPVVYFVEHQPGSGSEDT